MKKLVIVSLFLLEGFCYALELNWAVPEVRESRSEWTPLNNGAYMCLTFSKRLTTTLIKEVLDSHQYFELNSEMTFEAVNVAFSIMGVTKYFNRYNAVSSSDISWMILIGEKKDDGQIHLTGAVCFLCMKDTLIEPLSGISLNNIPEKTTCRGPEEAFFNPPEDFDYSSIEDIFLRLPITF